MFRSAIGLASLILFSACSTAPQISPADRAELAPAGKLRVGINYGNAKASSLVARMLEQHNVRGVSVAP